MDQNGISPEEFELLFKGDEKNWETFYGCFNSYIQSYINKRYRGNLSAEDVDEVCQNAYLSIVKFIHTWQDPSKPLMYIYRICRFKAYEYWQRKSKIIDHEKPWSLHEEDEKVDDSPLLEDLNAVLSNEMTIRLDEIKQAREILALFEKNHPECFELFRLRFFEDLKLRDVAKQINLSINTVAGRLIRCFHTFQEYWKM